jgi:hypothetical protein
MTKYRNPRVEAEIAEVEELEREEALMKEPATSVDEEVWKKRYGDLRRHVDTVQNDSKTRITELENKLEQALRGQLKAPKSDEDVELWMREYPEFAGILETIVQKRIREATSRTEEKLSKVELKQKELDAKEAFILLREAHPDLNELLAKDSDFRKWLDKQPEKYKNKMNSLDVEEASLVISKYKAENKKTRKSKVDDDDFAPASAAKVVTRTVVEEPDIGAGDYEFTESQISKMDSRTFEKYESAIMDASRRGKVLFDLSGGAR